MTKQEQIVTELEQMDEAAYREWVAETLGRRPKKAEMAEWLKWRREAELRRPEAKRAWAAERERLRVAERERLRVARQASRALTWASVTSWPWRETGGLLFLVIFVVGFFALLFNRPMGDVTIPGVPVGSAQEIARFRRQAELMQTQPCGTSFRLYDLSLVGAADWYMSCPGCAEIRADEILPMAILEEADRWSVNGAITVTELLQRTGECP